jgi:hypothetical protein
MKPSNYDEVMGYQLDGVDHDDLVLCALEQQWEFDELQDNVFDDLRDGAYLSPEGY